MTVVNDFFHQSCEELAVFPILDMCSPWHRITPEYDIPKGDLGGFVREYLSVVLGFTCSIKVMSDRVLFVAQVVVQDFLTQFVQLRLVEPIVGPAWVNAGKWLPVMYVFAIMKVESHVAVVVMPEDMILVDRGPQRDKVLHMVTPEQRRNRRRIS